MTRNVTGIGSEAFRGCPNLTQVTFGGDVKNIFEEAFDYSGNMQCINFTGNRDSIKKSC